MAFANLLAGFLATQLSRDATLRHAVQAAFHDEDAVNVSTLGHILRPRIEYGLRAERKRKRAEGVNRREIPKPECRKKSENLTPA